MKIKRYSTFFIFISILHFQCGENRNEYVIFNKKIDSEYIYNSYSNVMKSVIKKDNSIITVFYTAIQNDTIFLINNPSLLKPKCINKIPIALVDEREFNFIYTNSVCQPNIGTHTIINSFSIERKSLYIIYFELFPIDIEPEQEYDRKYRIIKYSLDKGVEYYQASTEKGVFPF